ncbi:MAG: 2-oxoglutarate dehydrogenase complex dihydrolipoyllysine-residue succinyltransferase, partial [Candidatus Omnitrophica bacterium]|nr:2-oxoglutarate dehydrogenase complex dihydrolipoyllysine-residue succinyltransferase [Candidatus Omnitrophota bacterium]
MSVQLVVPSIGESITEVFIGKWLKSEGEFVHKDEPLVELESDKATLELPAPVSGVLSRIRKKQTETAAIGEVIGLMEERVPATVPAQVETPAPVAATTSQSTSKPKEGPRVMPAAARVLAERGIEVSEVSGTGPGGRILKEDALAHTPGTAPDNGGAGLKTEFPSISGNGREVEVVPLSPMRRTIAARLVEAQKSAALLTTFNEIDMSEVMALRKKFQDAFLKRYNIKLGFMSFFVKAVVDALKSIPQVNAEIRDQSIVYHNYQDIGIAVSGGKGLVVPVLRNAERMSFSEIEIGIADFARRAGENKIGLDELEGGTFTISNGGIFGSLLSTPLVNPPQSAILGMHAIKERPIAVNGQVVIRPMMYLALSYDHRLVDGKESVTFLV